MDVTRPRTDATRGAFALILRNVTSNWAALLVNTLISFVLAPIVVHGLGSVYYGIWTLLMQFSGYLWLFDFGVRESVVKYVAQYHASGEQKQLESTVRTAVSVYSVVSLAALLIAVLVSATIHLLFNIPPEAIQTARLAAFLAAATVAQSFLSNVFVGVLMGLQRFYVVSRTAILFSVFRALATYALLTSGYGIVALSGLHLALSLVSSFVVFLLCRVYLPAVPLRPVRPARLDVAKLLNYGKYVLLANIGDKIVFATDAIVIGMFFPIAMLTPYAIAGTLIGNMRSVVMAMASIVNPLTSALQPEDRDESLARVVQTGAKGAMLVGLPLCIGFITLGESFIRLWMGETYAPTAGVILVVLSLGYIVGLPYYTISGVFYGLGAHRSIALLRLLEGAANLGLSIVLLRVYGLAGVAAGTAIPHILIVGCVLPRMLPRLFPIGLWDYYRSVYVRPLAASAPFWISGWLIAAVVRPNNLLLFFVWGTVSLVAYLVPCWLVALTPVERAHVVGAIRHRFPRGPVRPLGVTVSPDVRREV